MSCRCVNDWHVWSGWPNACHHLFQNPQATCMCCLLPTPACELYSEIKGQEDRVMGALWNLAS